MSARLTSAELDSIEDVLSRAPGCPDPACTVCVRIANGRAAWARARAILERVPADVATLAADAADYERRWLAAERARGDAERAAAIRAIELDVDDDDLCSCEPGNAYLCLRCERLAEEQDIHR